MLSRDGQFLIVADGHAVKALDLGFDHEATFMQMIGSLQWQAHAAMLWLHCRPMARFTNSKCEEDTTRRGFDCLRVRTGPSRAGLGGALVKPAFQVSAIGAARPARVPELHHVFCPTRPRRTSISRDVTVLPRGQHRRSSRATRG